MEFISSANALANANATAIAFANANSCPRKEQPMIRYSVHLKSYIAHPYWPEMERVINIQKESGMNRARSSANRRKALEEYLRSHEMTLADYEKLVERSKRAFHVDSNGLLYIPKRNVDAMLVATCDTMRAAGRPCVPDMVRTALRASSWTTDVDPDGALPWSRFAVVSSGTGARLSNQRGARCNLYMGDEPPDPDLPATGKVIAHGTFDLNPEMVDPKTLYNALVYAGEWVGIGASRKMGWGRFEMLTWENK